MSPTVWEGLLKLENPFEMYKDHPRNCNFKLDYRSGFMTGVNERLLSLPQTRQKTPVCFLLILAGGIYIPQYSVPFKGTSKAARFLQVVMHYTKTLSKGNSPIYLKIRSQSLQASKGAQIILW